MTSGDVITYNVTVTNTRQGAVPITVSGIVVDDDLSDVLDDAALTGPDGEVDLGDLVLENVVSSVARPAARRVTRARCARPCIRWRS